MDWQSHHEKRKIQGINRTKLYTIQSLPSILDKQSKIQITICTSTNWPLHQNET